MKTLYTPTTSAPRAHTFSKILSFGAAFLFSAAAFAQPCNTSQPRPITGEQTPCPGTTVTYCIENDRGYTSFVWEEPRAHAGNPPTGWTIVSGQGTNCVTLLVGTKPGTVKVTVQDPECGTKVATLPVHPRKGFQVELAGPDTVCFDETHTYTASLTDTENGNIGSANFSFNWTVPANWTVVSGQGTSQLTVMAGSTGGNVEVNVAFTGNNGNGTGIGHGRGYCSTANSDMIGVVIGDDCGPIVPLPVEMISFEAARSQASVLLNWATAQELNNDRFEIERSADGREFSHIATVQGNGTTQQRSDYRFTDSNAPASVVYYRLKQVDLDGQHEYSAVRAVRGGSLSAEPMQAYPNPTSGAINVQLPAELASDAVVRISSVTGQVVYSGTASDLAANNQSIDLSRFTSGIYIMTVSSGTENQSLRITKL